MGTLGFRGTGLLPPTTKRQMESNESTKCYEWNEWSTQAGKQKNEKKRTYNGEERKETVGDHEKRRYEIESAF